jgi:ABC-type dipeptide/oligopeptide/nickel transport system ATPase component
MSMLSIEGLRLTVPQGRGRRELLRGIDLTIDEGETLGLVGESGSGKSLTARAAIGLFPRGAEVSGSIRFDGREVMAMPRRSLRGYRGSEAAMIFQDPRAHINPRQRIGDFLCEGMTVMGNVPRAQALTRATALLKRVGIPDPERRLRQRPRELSGGLLQRVMIASALALHPRLLIADEATTALDVSTQNDVLHLIKELQAEAGISLILITHNLDVAAAVCDRTAVMYAGEVVETASSVVLHRVPRHPYTVGLLGARADATRRHDRLAVPCRALIGP